MKLYHGIMKALTKVVTGILFVVVAIVTIQVFFRFVLQNPLGWSEQLCRLFFLWGIMLGISVVFYEKNDLVFDVILKKFSPSTQLIMDLIFSTLGICFCVFYFIAGMILCLKTGSRMTTGIRMPVNILYGAQPVCAFFLCMVFIERFITSVKKLRRGSK